MSESVVYYISSHGFGHLTRSFEIIRKFKNIKTHIVCGHAVETAERFGLRGLNAASYREIKTDAGVWQKDALEMDLEKTLYENRSLLESEAEFILRESDYISKLNVSAVFSDISPFPFAVAKKLKIQGYAVGNFTWDWIYEGFREYEPGFREIAQRHRELYALADKAFVLPFSGPLDVFDRKIKIGLVCRKPVFSRPDEARESLGVKHGEKTVVLAFGGFGVETFLGEIPEGYSLILPGFEDRELSARARVVSTEKISFPDILLGADVVLTKPGYGIISELTYLELMGFGKKIFYCDRGPFREYVILKDFMDKKLQNSRYIPSGDMRKGKWIEYL
ncbi:hypothetical protein JW890_08655 [candidate division WOR-3 bacterium]|nr:hypothetical protein [candidate division WOR-3 bacterium]